MAKPKTKVVEAVANIVSMRTNKPLAKLIEAAQAKAIQEALDRGMSPHDTKLRDVISEAGRKVREEYAKQPAFSPPDAA